MKRISFLLSFGFLAQIGYSQPWLTNGTSIYYNGGNVGIGTNTPAASLDVRGNSFFLTGSNQIYLNGAGAYDPTKAGIRCNAGSLVVNSISGGIIYLNRDVNSDVLIESSPDGQNVNEIAAFKKNGYIGFGTTTPRTTIDVNGSFYLNKPTAMLDAQSSIGVTSGSSLAIVPSNISTSNDGYVSFLFPDNNSFRIGTNFDGHLGSALYRDLQFGRYVGDPYVTIKDGGNVLIGKTSQTNTSYILDVNGNARMNQVVVNTTGADYVFDPGYRLTPLKELAAYLKQEHHLPGVLPAAQMQQQGLDLGNNQTKLLAKVEELTLYTIEQDKAIESLKTEMQSLKQEIEELRSARK